MSDEFHYYWIVVGPENIYIGPFENKTEAEALRQRAMRGNHPDGWTVEPLIPATNPSSAPSMRRGKI